MSFSHQVGQSYKNDAGTVKSVTNTYTADFELALDDTVANGATNKEFDVALTLANLVSCVITCDKAVTVTTNATGGGAQDTISLAAGQAIIWANDHSEDAPFAGNVTKFYVTNSGSASARFQFAALLNQGVS